jgi:hypothetical protein
MIIRKPITSDRDKSNRYSTNLHFEGGARAKFYMRGSIAWPEGSQEGFAMMAGQNIESGEIFIFEQFPFWTIDHWLNPDKTIRKRDDGEGYHLGLIQFVQDNQALYKSASYFSGGQHVDICRRFSIDLYRNNMLPREHIELISVPYVQEVGDNLIIEKLQLRKYKAQTDSRLANSVKQWMKLRAAGTGDDMAVHALRILLAGYEYIPWKKMDA